MTDLNFPQNPQVGDTYSIGSRTWIWNGTAWQLQSAIQNLDPFTVKTLIVTSATNSTSTNTGAAIIEGGVGIGGDLNVGGTINVDKDLYVNGTLFATVSGSITTATNLANGFTGAIPYQTSEGATTFSNDFTFTNGVLYVSNEIYEGSSRVLTTVTPEAGTAISIDSLTTSSGNVSFVINNTGVTSLSGTTHLGVSNSTGDITLSNLGVTDLTGSTYIGVSASTGSITISNLGVLSLVNGTETVVTSSTGSNIAINVTSDLQSVTSRGATTNQSVRITSLESSNTYTNGALVVSGGVGIGENLNVGGTINVQSAATFAGPVTFSGTATFVFSTNTVYTDNLIELHTTSTGATEHWTFDDGKDIGLRFHYFNRNLNTGTSAALVLSNDEQMLEFYGTGAESPGGNFSEQTGATYGGFRTGQIFALSTTNSTTSTDSGALQVRGGTSIAKDLWVGGSIYQGGNLVVTQNQLSTLTVTALSAGPGISVTTASGIVTISNTGTLQSVTDNGFTTSNAINITNSTESTSTANGALVVSGGVGIGGDLNVGGSIVGSYGFIETTAAAGTNTTSNWWIRVLSFTLPNVGDSTTFKVRTNAKVLNNATFSDNSDSDYLYITYVRSSASGITGTTVFGNENSGASNSYSAANHTLTFSTATGYFEYWRRSPIAGGRIYTRLEEVLPAGVRPTLFTTSTWAQTTPQIGTSATISFTSPGTFGTIGASAATLSSGGVGLTVSGFANIGVNTQSGMTVQIAYGASFANSVKTVNIGTGGLAGSISTVTIGSSVAGALDRLVVNSSLTLFTSTAQSVSTTTGAVQIRGGLGVGGSVYATEIYDSNNRVITQVEPSAGTGINITGLSTSGGTVSFTVENAGVVSLTAGTDTAVTSSTGAVTVWNNSTLQTVTNRGSTTTNVIHIANLTPASSTNTGALTVAGGLGVGGDLWIGGILYSGGQAVLTTASFFAAISEGPDIRITEGTNNTVIISNTSTLQTVTNRGSTTTNAIRISNNTASTTTNTGALVVTGGVGIGGTLNASNINSAGTLTVNGASTLAATTVNGTFTVNGTLSLVGAGTGTAIAQFATGATASGNTKTVNIGTGGALGSNTVVNIGTTASTSTIILNGNVQLLKTVVNPSATIVNTSSVVIDSFGVNEYRSAKYFISISNTTTNQYQTSEIWLVQDGDTASIEQTSVFTSGTNYVVMFSTDITGGIVSLIGTGIDVNNRVKIQSTYITV